MNSPKGSCLGSKHCIEAQNATNFEFAAISLIEGGGGGVILLTRKNKN